MRVGHWWAYAWRMTSHERLAPPQTITAALDTYRARVVDRAYWETHGTHAGGKLVAAQEAERAARRTVEALIAAGAPMKREAPLTTRQTDGSAAGYARMVAERQAAITADDLGGHGLGEHLDAIERQAFPDLFEGDQR